MHLLIVRHGESNGQIDPNSTDSDSLLSVIGQQQAVRTAQRLFESGITQIICSPLHRALSTAQQISEKNGNLPVEVWPELAEINQSEYTGLQWTQILQQYPCAVFADGHPSKIGQYGGDTYQGIFTRCQQILGRIQAQHQPDDRVVLVTHGGLGNYLLHVILENEPDIPHWFELANCSISAFQFITDDLSLPLYPPVRTKIIKINDTSHL